MAELGRAVDLQAYSRHPKIAPKFLPQVYKTEISFGLHVGNAIEGSIGTYMKIDPLCLAPDVEIARRMNEMNDTYNTQVLFTGDFYELLSPTP